MAVCSSSRLEAAIAHVLRAEPQPETLKEIRALVEGELGLSEGALFERKKEVKSLVTALFNAPSPEKEAPARKKAKTVKPRADGQENAEDPRLTRLKALGRAMRAGPTLFKGLGSLGVEALVVALGSRLRDRGADFKGDAPSQKAIVEAEACSLRKEDLDGLDPSLIIQGGRRRRAAAAAAAAPTWDEDDDDDDESADGADSAGPLTAHDDDSEAECEFPL